MSSIRPTLLATFEHCIPCNTWSFTSTLSGHGSCKAKGEIGPAKWLQAKQPELCWVVLSSGKRLEGTISAREGVTFQNTTYRDGKFEIHENSDQTIRIQQIAHRHLPIANAEESSSFECPELQNLQINMLGTDPNAQVESLDLQQTRYASAAPSLPVSTPMAITLNGPFGSGKTAFPQINFAYPTSPQFAPFPSSLFSHGFPKVANMTGVPAGAKVLGKTVINQTGISTVFRGPVESKTAAAEPASEAVSSESTVLGEATHCDECTTYEFRPTGLIQQIDGADKSLFHDRAQITFAASKNPISISVDADGFVASNLKGRCEPQKNGIFQLTLSPTQELTVKRLANHSH